MVANGDATGHYGEIREDHPGTRKLEFRTSKINLDTVLGLLLVVILSIGLATQAVPDDAHGSDDFDLNTLIDRVAGSKALGFLTKLSLKRDIDRFLDSVRDFHKGTGDASLDQLRERYDALVHSLVVLVQDKDEELVKTIDDGRDKLWALLADEEKFKTL